jgi:copper chaperone NosL
MAISEQRYAAEWIDSRGNVYKFDDIGCMARFSRNRSGQAAVFVKDYDGSRWVAAKQAHYVRAPEIQSPMASGIIAFRDRAAAEAAAARYKASVLRFEQATEK